MAHRPSKTVRIVGRQTVRLIVRPQELLSCYSCYSWGPFLRIPTIPARDSNLKAATIPIEGGQYWPVGTFMGSQRW
jgi:hypothetical protein